MEETTLVVGEEKLSAHMFRPDVVKEKHPAALLIHGWESGQDRQFELAKILANLGYISMTVDLRGHGKSSGDIKKFSRKEFLEDVKGAYDSLVQIKEVDADNVLAIGSSFGSYLVALLSAERKLKALVLRVPANYSDEGFEDALQHESRLHPAHDEWKSKLQDHSQNSALRAVHNFSGKILLVQSEKDEQVRSTVIESYMNAAHPARLTHVIMKGAPHSITKYPNFQREYYEIVTNWLQS